MTTSLSHHNLISKTILHTGSANVSFSTESKVWFHFETRLTNEEKTVIDDSKKLGKPMELILGRSFKLSVWETLVQAMALKEVAKFVVDQSMVREYPMVSKVFRQSITKEKQSHCCASAMMTHGTGYSDLDQLVNNPQDLEFTIELLKVESPDEYEKDDWQLSGENKLEMVPKLKEQGNELYKQKKYKEAAEKYSKAIGYLEHLKLSEKPKEAEWMHLNTIKLGVLLNYVQCQLQLKDYYSVIEHSNTVLEYQSDNIKALYRRGLAHLQVWNVQQAKDDLLKVKQLDPSMSNVIQNHLKDLRNRLKIKQQQDKEKLSGKLFNYES